MRKNRILAVCVSLLAGAHLANAQVKDATPQIFPGITDDDCAQSIVDNERLRELVLAQAKVPFSYKIAKAIANQELGDIAENTLGENCGGKCTPMTEALQRLREGIAGLMDEPPFDSAKTEIIIDAIKAPPPKRRPTEFLNGNWQWLTVRCKASPAIAVPPASGDAATPKAPDAAASGANQRAKTPEAKSSLPSLVLGKSEDDAGKEFSKRGFATVGMSADWEEDKSTWDVDAFIGWDKPFQLSPSADLMPFVAWQYHTGKKIDDLTLGGALIWLEGNLGEDKSVIRIKPAWETDHHFRSSLWRLDATWTPPVFGACERTSNPGVSYANCEITLVADYAEVANPGRKAALATVANYARVGVDMAVTYAHAVTDDLGYISASAGLSIRQAPDDKKTDAELFTASLGFLPSKKGAWKISLDYSRGRDLTELTKQDKIVLSVGVRQ